MNYPSYLPDECPPKESVAASGEFYRFIHPSHKSPQADDFLGWLIEYPDRPYDSNIPECQAYGTSVYPTLDAIKNMRTRVKALRKKKIARGELNSNFGVIQNTPSQNEKSHHTWWIPEAEGIEPWKVFQIIELDKN
jgi:hypothetical protein